MFFNSTIFSILAKRLSKFSGNSQQKFSKCSAKAQQRLSKCSANAQQMLKKTQQILSKELTSDLTLFLDEHNSVFGKKKLINWILGHALKTNLVLLFSGDKDIYPRISQFFLRFIHPYEFHFWNCSFVWASARFMKAQFYGTLFPMLHWFHMSTWILCLRFFSLFAFWKFMVEFLLIHIFYFY